MGRPPMEEGVLSDEVRLLLEVETARCLHLLERREIGKAPVGQRLIGQWPEMLRRLQFGGVGRQEDEVDACRDLNRLPGVPARAIEHQQDLLGGTCPHIPSKGGEHLAEDERGDGREEPPLGCPRAGTDEATDIEPLVALLDGGDRPPAFRCPDPPDQGQEPDPMLVGRPEFDLGCRMRRLDRGDLISQIFF